MGELEKLANVPSEFIVNSKVYKVKELSLMQLAGIRQKIIDAIKTEYKKDIADLVVSLPEKERTKYMLEALNSFKVTDEQMNNKLMDTEGFIAVLSIALNEDEKVIKEVFNDNQEVLWEVYSHAMKVNNDEEETPNSNEPEIEGENKEDAEKNA